MLSHEIFLLVTCLSALCAAIRVDWNTNKGPIIPPTPRTTVRPQPPYRQPAPVWEDQSNDIPNPHPYVYILPPPSRPRPATNNYLTFDRRPADANYNIYNNNNQYGSIVSPNQAAAYQQNGNSHIVPALSTKYIPNVGNKYSAVVAAAATTANGYYVAEKFQGKFNAKTKKYKAYETKSKYVPLNYYPLSELAPPGMLQHIFDSEQLVRQQQLPLQETHKPFHTPTTTPQPTKQVRQASTSNTNSHSHSSSNNNSKWTQLKNASKNSKLSEFSNKSNEKSSLSSPNALGNTIRR